MGLSNCLPKGFLNLHFPRQDMRGTPCSFANNSSWSVITLAKGFGQWQSPVWQQNSDIALWYWCVYTASENRTRKQTETLIIWGQSHPPSIEASKHTSEILNLVSMNLTPDFYPTYYVSAPTGTNQFKPETIAAPRKLDNKLSIYEKSRSEGNLPIVSTLALWIKLFHPESMVWVFL